MKKIFLFSLFCVFQLVAITQVTRTEHLLIDDPIVTDFAKSITYERSQNLKGKPILTVTIVFYDGSIDIEILNIVSAGEHPDNSDITLYNVTTQAGKGYSISFYTSVKKVYVYSYWDGSYSFTGNVIY